MKKLRSVTLSFVIISSCAMLLSACEVGTNPLLFDGSPVTAKLRVEQSGASSYDYSVTVDLQGLFAEIKNDIDSVKVFNITLLIDSLTNGTDSLTTISGTAYIDDLPLFDIPNPGIALKEFGTERSIFDSHLTGFSFKAEGVSQLIDILNDYAESHTLPSVTVRATGSASSSNLHFTVKLKLYTQVFTKS